MGKSYSQDKGSTQTSDASTRAREKIRVARLDFLAKLKDEIEKTQANKTTLNDRDETIANSEIQVDAAQYNFPFTNLVLEGGGVKGTCYIGLGRALEEHGILQKITRFAGTSVGAIFAAMFAVGCNSYDIEMCTDLNLENLSMDASWGYFSLIPNLLRRYGWNPGTKAMNFIGAFIEAKTGNPDLTFAQLYKSRGVELCILGVNVNTKSEEYFHVKTTPDMPIRLAVRISMGLPGIFQAVSYKMYKDDNFYVDGGLMCNYPVHCFDGWWLSMKPKDSFLKRIQPIENLFQVMDRKNRFNYNPKKNKTLGCIVFDQSEEEYMRRALQKKSGVERGKLPDTALAKNWMETEGGKGTLDKVYALISEAVDSFMKHLSEINDDDRGHGGKTICRDEFNIVFSKVTEDHLDLLFGPGCSPTNAFDAIDIDGSGELSYSEILNFIEEIGVSVQEKYLGTKRSEVTGFGNYLGTIFGGLSQNMARMYMEPSDVDRTIGINTWYITTLDFVLEKGDREFIIDQGKRSTQAFLQSHVLDNNPEKLSQAEIQSRAIPTGPSLSKEEIEKILVVGR